MPLNEFSIFNDDEDDDLLIDLEDVDLEALARQIYELLREELRLERDRQGWYRDY